MGCRTSRTLPDDVSKRDIVNNQICGFCGHHEKCKYKCIKRGSSEAPICNICLDLKNQSE